ncbi:alpha/beta fold hydrolase [Thermodesulfobacteriota bacterium]
MSNSFLNIDQGLDAITPTIFLPGWGFDGRVIRLLMPSQSWIYPETFLDPGTIGQDILNLIAQCNINKVRIIGWSMGAMLGLDFAAKHPEKVESLILVSLRSRWPDHEIKELQGEFAENPEGFLMGFYRKCFLGDKQSYRLFCKTLEPLYLTAIDMYIERLQRGLEFLENFKPTSPASTIPVRLIHGKQDIIAPITEMATLKGSDVEIIENSGHTVFLAESCSLQTELRKQAIKKKFSRAADSYDNYAKVQTEVALKLAAKLALLHDTTGVQSILEIGCGTGNFTSMLAAKYPAAKIVALDFSPEMIAKASYKLKSNKIEYICAEGEEFLQGAPAKSFDLVVSNGSLQWFTDHDQALKNIARILPPGGAFLCSIFGPDSLKKLGLGLKTLFKYQGNVAANAFPDVNSLQRSLYAYFTKGTVGQELIEKQYDSVHDLLVHIKKTGTGGWQQYGSPALTPARLKQLDHWFAETYGCVKVIYQIHFLQATK